MKKISAVIYRFVKWCVKVCYPRITVVGEENLPDEPCIIVGNHTLMNGPIACELYTPGKHYTWCNGEMMHLKDVPQYAFEDFWSKKPKRIRWFYKILSYIIAPLSVCVFNNANTIGVYRDSRILGTFKNTVAKLQEGARVVIFPEHDVPYNHIICEFQDKFIDIAKLYYKRTGKEICFVPMYLAPALKKMYFGRPIYFNVNAPIAEERIRICHYLMEEVTKIACSLPVHTVIPFKNKPKKEYVTNIPTVAHKM